jgi:hypothetical protein
VAFPVKNVAQFSPCWRELNYVQFFAVVTKFRSEVNPLAEFRRLGINARLAWHGDDDSHALLLVDASPDTLARLSRVGLWAGAERPLKAAA